MNNITKNKNKDTIYAINKPDSIVTFKGHDYNINDSITAKNLIYFLIDKCAQNDDLINDYKTITKNQEALEIKLSTLLKQYENDMKNMDKDYYIVSEKYKTTKKENTRMKTNLEMFFKVNETIIKEF